MPQTALSYSKSLLHQLNDKYIKHSLIIRALFVIWQEAIIELKASQIYSKRLDEFQYRLQEHFLSAKYEPLFKDLLMEAISAARSN